MEKVGKLVFVKESVKIHEKHDLKVRFRKNLIPQIAKMMKFSKSIVRELQS